MKPVAFERLYLHARACAKGHHRLHWVAHANLRVQLANRVGWRARERCDFLQVIGWSHSRLATTNAGQSQQVFALLQSGAWAAPIVMDGSSSASLGASGRRSCYRSVFGREHSRKFPRRDSAPALSSSLSDSSLGVVFAGSPLSSRISAADKAAAGR